MTGRDLISSSLRLLGVLASGESLSDSEANDGLTSLNALIDSWSNYRLLITTIVREVFTLTANQQTYAMGSGGDFDTSRPIKIENALLRLTSVTPVLELPMTILNQDQYARVSVKALTATYPLYLFSDNAYPKTNISLWPVPTAANSLVLYSSKPLTEIATLDTALSVQPGMERALKYNLALELAPEYGKEPSQLVVSTAIESLAAVKRSNMEPRYLEVDPALLGKPAVFNWLTGDPQ